ncbi:MAG: AMP-binding protein, partial [Planctomycetes bacterium]|nr:AMP-binding protein [Planctomycetota bacterium]
MKAKQALERYPLSSPQRDIWFDQVMYPSVPLYNVGGYAQINGAINPVLFESAVNLLVQKHDALRTVLVPSTEEMPMQTFLEDLPVTVPVHDFSGENNPRRSALVWMQHKFVQPFDLCEKPLFHFALLKIDENCFFWFGKYHHLIVDGWSISLITQSLAQIYTNLVEGLKNEDVGPSYLQFVEKDLSYIESERHKADLKYWLEKYQTLPEPLFMPQYLSRFVDQVPPSECRVLSLRRHFYNRLISLARSCEVSTFHLILGVLYVYLTRTAQTEELVVGLPVLNRSNAALKNTVGLFVGVSVARLAFGTELSFKTLLQSIGRELKQNYRFQRLPVSELNSELGLQQFDRNQLFDISVSYEKQNYDTIFDTSPARAKSILHGYEQTPLMVYVREFHDYEDVDIDFVYNLACFDASDIERIQSRFMMILEYVLNHVDESICTIPLITESEHQQLVSWNRTDTEYPEDLTIVDLFEAQVEKTPDNIAVVFEEQVLSYCELNTKVNQLASHLITLGVGAETMVGVCVGRSLDMMVGLLGILKAGGAYVPLDPEYPRERLRFMLENANVPVLLSQSHLLERLPVFTTKVVCLDSEWEEISCCSQENPERRSGPENLMYVIHTSGSTGVPSGVMIEHRSKLNHLHAIISQTGLTATDIVAQNSSPVFDISIWQLLAALMVGGRVNILNKETVGNPVQLLKHIVQERITILELV